MISSPTPLTPISLTSDPAPTGTPAGPRVMLLRAGSTTIAIAASAAREVAPRHAAIRLPGTPEFVTGVINVRGTLVPLVDLGRLLDAEPADPSGWVVTLDLEGRRCALAVDSLPVLRAADAPPGARPTRHAFLSAEVCVSGTTLPLLDVDALADDILLQ
jgi:purine-binding chemotaxis protein CheW